MEKVEEERKLKLSFRSVPTRSVTENSKKITKKLKKYHSGIISNQKRLEKAQREKIKIIVSFHSDPTRKGKFKKNNKKIQ